MLTFKLIQDDVITKLREDVSDPNYWSLDEIKYAINDVYTFIADERLCFKLEAIIEVQSGIRTYKLPPNYIIGSLRRVEYDSEMIYPISSDELDAMNSTWKSQSGRPTHYLNPGDICNTDEISLFPKPDTTGAAYNTADDSLLNGVIVATGDDSYEEFAEQDGIIVDAEGEATFVGEERGPVIDLYDPTDNLRIYAAKYPKRLYNDNEVFLHPITENPRQVLTKGTLAILFAKEGEGKDIAKASYYNKRYMEAIDDIFKKNKMKRRHRMGSVSEISLGQNFGRALNLGSNYPTYVR